MRRTLMRLGCTVLVASAVISGHVQAQTANDQTWPAEPFRLAWQRTDSLVASGSAGRSWIWGPQPRSAPLRERDDDSPGGYRLVQYYDKGRMELPLPYAGIQSTAQLSYGRLVAEMVAGTIQLGAQRFDGGPGARIPVVGDRDDTSSPTYASFGGLTGVAPPATGSRPGQSLDRSGSIVGRPELSAAHPETAYAAYDGATGHNVSRVFSDFMARSGVVNTPTGQRTEQVIDPLSVVGHPISEAYWVDAKVGGSIRPVLVQLFERRVLSYTPSNPAASQVELGNVGAHYYEWRYGAQARSGRLEQVFSHFENGAQALSGGYWFSFDDQATGGTSTASEHLISPGVDNSAQAIRFDYNVTTAIEFSFASLSGNISGPASDMRHTTAIGFWARGSTNRINVQLNSALSDAPFSAEFIPTADWSYVELPLSSFKQDSGQRLVDLPQAVSNATRMSFRPGNRPSQGYLDVDNILFISGESTPTVQAGLPLIDDFEDGSLTTTIGTEWFTYTDADSGGGSTADLAIVSPGVNNSRAALRFRGSFNKQWAETPFLGMGVPLVQNNQPADLTTYRGVQISIKTDGQRYRLQVGSKLITDNNQYGIVLLGPANQWSTIIVPFSLMTPQSPKNAMPQAVAFTQVENLIITPLDQPKAFQLLIDNVQLVK